MNIADVVKKYVDSYGFDALADERRFSSFVDDMVSENGVEKNIVKQALNAGIYERFLSKAESGDKKAIANAAVDYLQKNLGITEEWAAFAAQIFADALGWGITVERKPKSAPEPSPAPAPSQPTPAPKPAQPTPRPTPTPTPKPEELPFQHKKKSKFFYFKSLWFFVVTLLFYSMFAVVLSSERDTELLGFGFAWSVGALFVAIIGICFVEFMGLMRDIVEKFGILSIVVGCIHFAFGIISMTDYSVGGMIFWIGAFIFIKRGIQWLVEANRLKNK